MDGFAKTLPWLVVLLLLTGWTGASEAAMTPEEVFAEIVVQVEATREQHGLPLLVDDVRLAQVAAAHSEQMAAELVLADGEPFFEAPVDRARGMGVSETVQRVVVATGSTVDELLSALGSEGNLATLGDPALTHMGIGVAVAADRSLWLTIHMVERLISFNHFRMRARMVDGVSRQMIRASGSVNGEGMQIRLLYGGQETIVPVRNIEPNGEFVTEFMLEQGAGGYRISFDVLRDNVYRETNSIDYTVR